MSFLKECEYFDPSHLFKTSESFSQGVARQTPEIPLYGSHNFVPVQQIFCHKYPEMGSSGVCHRYASNNQCGHTKVYFPPLRPLMPAPPPVSQSDTVLESRCDDVTDALCLPTLTNSDLKNIFGSSLDLLSPISRYELLEKQRQDADLLPIFHFFEEGFPTVQQFHRLYSSERTGFYFNKRKLLRLQVDGVLHLARTPGETVLSERVVLPASLIYKALVLSHNVGSSFHKSIKDTYDEINTRFSVFRLQDHVRYFVRSCQFCFLSKQPKPTQDKTCNRLTTNNAFQNMMEPEQLECQI